MITVQEAGRIEQRFDAADMVESRNSQEAGRKFAEAWRRLWSVMERENNFSNNLGSSILD